MAERKEVRRSHGAFAYITVDIKIPITAVNRISFYTSSLSLAPTSTPSRWPFTPFRPPLDSAFQLPTLFKPHTYISISWPFLLASI